MDDPRFAAARMFPRKPHGAHAGLPRRSHRRKALGTAAASALLVAGVAAGCGTGGGGNSASSPITICEIAATSGPFSQLGTNDELGASAWATMVNKAGGVLGHKVTLVQENDASNPATAAALVHKCVSQVHANFIFGPEETSTASAAVPVANQLQTVLLGWQSGWNGQGISNSNLHSYSFPGIGNVFFADDLATVTQLIVPRHYTKVAVIEDNAPGGLGNTQYMQSLAPKYGYQVVASQVTNPGATDDTPQVLNLLKANPQIIVLGLIPGPDTITFIKAVRAQNPTIRRFWPRRYRRSDVYMRLLGLDRRFDIADRLDRRAGRPLRERVVQDIEVPVANLSAFLEWFDDEVGMRPVWLCPLVARQKWPSYPLQPGEVYVNAGFWGTVHVGPDAPNGPKNRAIETKVHELGGHGAARRFHGERRHREHPGRTDARHAAGARGG